MQLGRRGVSDLGRAWIAQLDDDDLDELRRRLGIAEPPSERPGPEPDGWLDSKQAAAYVGMTRNALHKRTAAGDIPCEQEVPGGKRWFKRSELDAWRRGQNPSAAKALPRGQSGEASGHLTSARTMSSSRHFS
jgi:hypothetical protein